MFVSMKAPPVRVWPVWSVMSIFAVGCCLRNWCVVLMSSSSSVGGRSYAPGHGFVVSLRMAEEIVWRLALSLPRPDYVDTIVDVFFI